MHHSNRWIGLLIACLALLGAERVFAADWPQWRGPQRDGISRETGLLKEWPAEGPKLLWQAKDIGHGYSTPAVVGERLYLLSNRGEANEFVQALDVKDGRQVWSTRLGNVGPNIPAANYPGARSTPTVDGALLYALGSDGNLACLETAMGKVRWQKNLRTDFGGKTGNWAYAESPLIDGEVLVCTPGGSVATLVALNKRTGDVIWKSAVPGGDPAAYSSAIVVEVGGVKQYVQFLGNGVVGVDAKSGKFLWRDDRTAAKNQVNIPTPVASGGSIYSASAGSGGGLVKLTVNQGMVTAQPVYAAQKLPNSIGGSVRVGEYLYGTAGPVLVCVEFATGTIQWEDRGIGTGSVLYADGRLYLHGETRGDVALVEATPEGYREKGRFMPPDAPDRGPSRAWAYPVVANGRLYIRDLGSLWCYDVKAAAAAR
jgi:outer membrane protein assembly factor BamB